MDSDKKIALYYPYIDIKDAGLIKTAALYWDKLQTIVPLDPYGLYSERREATSVTEFYKTDASREAKKEGFLEERIVNPMDESVQQTGRNFISDLREIPEIKESLANILRSKQWRHALADKYTTIYMEKFDPGHLLDLVFELKDAGVQFTSLTDGSNGIIVPKPFADMYMSRMASVIAQKDGSVPLTNESLWQDAALARVIDYSKERKQNQSELARLSLQTIAVNPDVPLIDILKFRDKHRKDLINYRKQIRELAWHISKGLTDSEKQSLFEDMVKDKFLPVKEEVEAKLSQNADWFMINNTSIMVAGIGAILLSGGQAWLASLFQGAVAVGINILGTIRDDRKCVKDHPLGYLYQAQKKFGAKK
jgi:hypothetical protein